MAIKELFYDQRPVALINPRASQRIDPRFKYTRDSLGSYVDSDGLIKTKAPNVPRLSSDPITGTSVGLLVEPQATNLVLWSGAVNVTPTWSAVRVTVTPNSEVAPDGTASGATVTPNLAPNGYVRQFVSVTANTTYTFSIFAKKQASSSFRYLFLFASTGGAEPGAYFDTETGEVTPVNNAINPNMESFSNGWYRCSFTATVPSITSVAIVALPTKSNTSTSYSPDGTGMYVWGAQVEQNDTPTSYIPTTTSQATRAADLLSISALPIPTTGSVFIDAQARFTGVGKTLISIKNASNQKLNLAMEERSELYNSLAQVYSIQGAIKPTLPFPVPTTDRERNIITWGANNYQYTTGTARFAQSLSGSVPANLTQLSIGTDSVDPTKAFNGYINAAYLYSGEITPAVAEALVRGELDPVNADTFVPSGPAGSLSIVVNTQGAASDGDRVFELPAESVANNNDIVITWGDGTESGLENAAAELGAPGLTKTYSSAGIYPIYVEGRLENLQFNNIASAPDLVQIVSWGTTADGNDVFLSPSTMNSAFYGCSQLDFSSTAKTTNIPDTSAVTNWFRAFKNCSSITGLFPQFDFSSATTLQEAFDGCSSLTAFTAAGNQTQNVVNFGNAWRGCSSLTSFPLIDTSAGTNFDGTWQTNSSLTTFPLINTGSGTSFVLSWYNCSGLTSFPLINTSNATTFRLAWNGCNSLTSFPLLDASQVTDFLNTWYGCGALTSFPLLNTGSGINFTATWLSCVSLTSFPLIDTSSGTLFASTWYNCNGLTSFPLINTSAGTTFTAAWYNCNSLTSFPLIDTSAGTNFSRTWLANSALTSFPALNFDAATGLASDPSGSFTGFLQTWFNCGNLANFPANLFDSTTCTRFLDAWKGCALTAQSIENILVSINTANTSNGNLGLDAGTNAAQSTWTSAATTAYNALVGRGWTITFNP